MKLDHIISLMALNANLQLAHWQADTITNAHQTIGKLYEALTGLLDDFAEVAMGKLNSTAVADQTISILPNASVSQLLAFGQTLIADCRAELTAGMDDDLLNILADMSAAINRAKYLLRL